MHIPTLDRPPRVLFVDDDPAVARTFSRVLTAHGYQVALAEDGATALTKLNTESFNVVFSDVEMPGMSGLELMSRVHQRDPDLPVVLITGNPSLDSAILAIEGVALRYLTKPVDPARLRQVADEAVRVHVISMAQRRALSALGGMELVRDRAGLEATLSRTMSTLFLAYQPIISWKTKSVFGYEALLRSREVQLPHPGAVLEAAERLNRMNELGRTVRDRVGNATCPADNSALLFVNVHGTDLLDPHLFERNSALSAIASRVVLEITERASLNHIADLTTRRKQLRELGFRLAVDDLGAGYAGLTSFAALEPEIVKLDMSLVRDINVVPTKQKLVQTMISMSHDMGILVVAEGIETEAERDTIIALGGDLLQGYLIARPGPAYPTPKF